MDMGIDTTGLATKSDTISLLDGAFVSYHHIPSFSIDHFLRAARAEHARRRQKRDLTIFDSDIVVRGVGSGHDETVDHEEVEVIHGVALLATCTN
jgi:hypothetical protein